MIRHFRCLKPVHISAFGTGTSIFWLAHCSCHCSLRKKILAMLFLRGEDTWLWSETPYIAAVFMAQIFKMAVKV